MVYVRTVKTSSGATAVQIVHSNRRGSKDIEHLGSAPDSYHRQEPARADRGWSARPRLGAELHLTNIPAGGTDIVGIEAWFRMRTGIEDRFREAKHGAALIHLPSADATVNTVWMWAALLAGALNVMLHALSGPTHEVAHDGRVRIQTLRAQTLNVPARMLGHARGLTLHLPPGQTTLPAVLERLRALPLPT